jgi:hypothetical protein
MDKMKLANRALAALADLNITGHIMDSGSSVYLLLDGCKKAKQIRFSDHHGRKSSRNSFDVRSDCCTHRASGIFNVRDMGALISIISKGRKYYDRHM